MKKQISLELIVAPILLVVAVVGFFLLVKPKQSEAGRLDTEIAELETTIQVALAAQKAPAPDGSDAIVVADLFRLTKAMPDGVNMPGIILELNAVASAAGISFDSIAPLGPTVRTTYSAVPINLSFQGNFFDFQDFLFRLRNLVRVRDGALQAEGRLFTLDTLTLTPAPEELFPQIIASLTLTSFVYATDLGPPVPGAAPAAPPADTTETTTTEDDSETEEP